MFLWIVIKNLRELSVNILQVTICMNHEDCEWQFLLFFVILSEKFWSDFM